MLDYDLSATQLGKPTLYKYTYDPQLLYIVERQLNRQEAGINTPLPFYGVDYWTAYEVSWLDLQGKPAVGLADIAVPCTSPYLVESKSLKLYLNSFNHTHFTDRQQVEKHIQEDLSKALQTDVSVTLALISETTNIPGVCLDNLAISTDTYTVDPTFLTAQQQIVHEQLYSHLLCSICPVTAQPDWGTIMIEYAGPQIDHAGLLKYIISFRSHPGFHEACVEQIFNDILQRCKPEKLSVYARYTRRGGIDINPFRSNFATAPGNVRLLRQ